MSVGKHPRITRQTVHDFRDKQPANVLLAATFVLLFNASQILAATTHNVTSADDIASLIEEKKLSPGDTIVWADGIYIDQEIELNNISGNDSQPITLKAQSHGGVVFQGESQIRINSQWWVISGFHFQGTGDRPSAYNPIQFRGSGDVGAEHVRLTNCAFTSLDNREETSKWVQIYGRFNKVDHCHFTGKANKGALVTVELGAHVADETAGHIIEWNYFADVAPKKGNDNETIRIGFSGDQNKPSKCIVRRNLFERCNGETEIVSNKSSHNFYHGNTFRACNGSLVLRHGHHATVSNNYFLGDGASDAGGIRINDSHHLIFNNYMQDLTGLTWNAALSIEGGKKKSGATDNGYQVVEGIHIVHNTIVNCSKSVFLNREHGKHRPTGIFANNLVYLDASRKEQLFDVQLATDGIQWTANQCSANKVGIESIRPANLKMKSTGGLWRLEPPIAAGQASGQKVPRFEFVKHDILGNPRKATTCDIGAIEFTSQSPAKSSEHPLVKSQVGTDFLTRIEERAAHSVSATKE